MFIYYSFFFSKCCNLPVLLSYLFIDFFVENLTEAAKVTSNKKLNYIHPHFAQNGNRYLLVSTKRISNWLPQGIKALQYTDDKAVAANESMQTITHSPVNIRVRSYQYSTFFKLQISNKVH